MTVAADVHARALKSEGKSDTGTHRSLLALLAARGANGVLADIGCGTGQLFGLAGPEFSRRVGVDAVRYPDLPPEIEFALADLDSGRIPLEDASVDAATAIEVIEHLDNPRALVREMTRITRPGGWIAITTPNQLSALSLFTLILRGQFNAFQELDYPAHRTALLPIDLERMATENGLASITVEYSRRGRIPKTGRHYPRAISRLLPRWCSDNVIMVARR